MKVLSKAQVVQDGLFSNNHIHMFNNCDSHDIIDIIEIVSQAVTSKSKTGETMFLSIYFSMDRLNGSEVKPHLLGS